MDLSALILAASLTMQQSAKVPAAVQREIESFVGHLQSGRTSEAYGQLSAEARQDVGRAQFDAYIASRRRALGSIFAVANVRSSDHVDPEPGMFVYDADVRFEKGSAPAGFILSREGSRWRIQRFVIGMPDGVEAKPDANDVPPIAKEFVARAKADGTVAIVTLISEKDLADAEQTPEMAMAIFKGLDDLLGRLQTFTLEKPEPGDTGCMNVEGRGSFAHGQAPLKLVLCWTEGIWRLRHATISPQLDPLLLERSIAQTFHGKVAAVCPRDAKLPVGGNIVCRVTESGKPPKNATILRTTFSGWKVVALEPAGQ